MLRVERKNRFGATCEPTIREFNLLTNRRPLITNNVEKTRGRGSTAHTTSTSPVHSFAYQTSSPERETSDSPFSNSRAHVHATLRYIYILFRRAVFCVGRLLLYFFVVLVLSWCDTWIWSPHWGAVIWRRVFGNMSVIWSRFTGPGRVWKMSNIRFVVLQTCLLIKYCC